MKNLEIRTIEHKGIKVTIKIDYDKGEASLVETSFGHGDKKWLFSNRGLGYMLGWLNILEAMQIAVKECKKELELSFSQSNKYKESIIIKANKMILNIDKIERKEKIHSKKV